jgi:hypothetical protein
MDLVSTGPLRVASLRWLFGNGAPALTVVCKATFSLRPGESQLAPQQDEPNEDDTYWDDDSQRSLSASTDLVPFKARADVILVGSAHSATAVRSLVARLRVGSVDKSIEVHADRAFGADGILREGMPFTRMRLRYERAAGGPETWNPVGMRLDVHDVRGNTVLPNLQPVGAQVARRGDSIAPVGFGPIAPGWRERAMKVHRSAPGWSPHRWTERPLPDGFDASFFNVAPSDQQLDALRPDEPIELHHLHAEHPRLTTRLADIAPRATVERPSTGPVSLALVCDTLAIDTDRGVCHLVWRGTLRLAHPAEAGRVTVSLADSAPEPWEKEPSLEEMGSQTIAPMLTGGAAATMPFFPRGAETERPAPRTSGTEGGLPFHRENAPREPQGALRQPAPPRPLPPLSPQGSPDSTAFFAMPDPVPVHSPGAPAAQGPLPPAAMPPLPAPPPPPAPPPAVPPPVAPIESSPWASARAQAAEPPSRASIGERIQKEPPPAPVAPPDERRMRGEPEMLSPLSRSGENAVPSFLAAAAVAGVVAASNAAADPPPLPPRAGRPAAQRRLSDAVDLLWFDADSVARIRKKPAWRALLLDLESSGPIDAEESSLGNTPEEIEDRRDILHVLVHGSPVDDYGITEAMEQAVRSDGKIIQPLVLTAGELAFAFDELEMLKATLSAALPLAQGDEQLTAATASAKDFLSTPGLLATGTVIDALTHRLREAFLRVKRPVPADYLTVQSERALLEKRHYQKREVFSKTHLRGLFTPPGASSPVPTYLPEEVAKKLPLYQRFSVRMIVEVHRTTDQNEVHPAALRALALGRTVAPPR